MGSFEGMLQFIFATLHRSSLSGQKWGNLFHSSVIYASGVILQSFIHYISLHYYFPHLTPNCQISQQCSYVQGSTEIDCKFITEDELRGFLNAIRMVSCFFSYIKLKDFLTYILTWINLSHIKLVTTLAFSNASP